MKREDMLALLHDAPVIAAVKDDAGLEACLGCEAQVVFVLYGTVVSIASIVGRIHEAGKLAILHLDLVDGLSPREAAVDYIAAHTKADGIISTKPAIIRRAMEKGLLTVRRFFLLDSLALQNIRKTLAQDAPDFIEVLPGVMPKMLRQLSGESSVPLIAGGLISDKEDIISALSAGAVAISTTNPAIWNV